MTGRTEGLIAAPFTPLGSDGSIQLDRVPELAALLARNGVVGAFVCGTTGESLSLTEAERCAVVERWVASVDEGFRVIVHVGHDSIETACALARHAQESCADAIAAMAPSFFRIASAERVVELLERIAGAAPGMPLYYYHLPAMTGCAVSIAEVLERASGRIPSLVGVKFTHGDLADLALSLEGAGTREILYGCDEQLLPALALGVRGAVGSTYNFLAPLYRRIMAAFDAGRLEEARRLQCRSAAVVRAIGASGVPFLSAAKSLMATVGVDCGPPRWPLPTLPPDGARALRARLDAIVEPEDWSR